MIDNEGDVLLFQTDDDGDIIIENGLVKMTGGLETSLYLALFGGDEDDSGADDDVTWWGNLQETDPAMKYVSETQYLLQSIPAVPFNLIRIDDAVQRDSAYLTDVGAASSVESVVSIPAINRVKIAINIKAVGDESDFLFSANWKASA